MWKVVKPTAFWIPRIRRPFDFGTATTSRTWSGSLSITNRQCRIDYHRERRVWCSVWGLRKLDFVQPDPWLKQRAKELMFMSLESAAQPWATDVDQSRRAGSSLSSVRACLKPEH